jgi:hypothetical protein
MEVINAKEYNSNPSLNEPVEPDNHLKNFLVEYVGDKYNPEDGEVTVEMIAETMAAEFPEFLLAVAEENWVRGYQQALDDVEVGRAEVENLQNEVHDQTHSGE